MKLLSKDQINVRKSSEMRKDIESGLKIAGKVDEVRETLVKEEGALTKFRFETTKIVQKEISDLINKRDALERDIAVLKRRDNLLKKPFDEEWEAIRNARIAEIDAMREEILNTRSSVDRKEKDLAKRISQLEIEEDRIGDASIKMKENLQDSERMRLEAEEIQRNSEAKKDKIERQLDSQTRILKAREAQVTSAELDLENREEAIRRASKALADKERAITDKYETLLRTEARLKK